jgi:hypothetical protein
LILIITALIFYAYTTVTGAEILIVDIFIFAVAITAGQLISYKILTAVKLPEYANMIAAAFIILMALVLILFTFYPPHLPIFLDANTGMYGIPR